MGDVTWQPEATLSLAAAIEDLEREFPGWWWRVGACHVSADATIGPCSVGSAAHWLERREFDAGFDCDLRQPASCAEALRGAMDAARAAISKAKGETT